MASQAGPEQWTGRQAVITLPEQIDVSNAGQIREALLSAINRGATALIADMTATISCDYAGADAVVRAYQRAILAGTELRLVVTAHIVRRVLTTSGLDRLVAIYPSLESATARTPAVVLARPGGPPGDGRARPDSGGPRDASTAVAPAVLGQMVDAFQDGVALADDHGTIVLASLRLGAMFGYQHGEVLGHPVEFLVPADLQDGHRSLRAGYDRAPRTRPMGDQARLVGLRKDGTTFLAQISLSPVRTAAGQFTLAVIRDVTGTRQLEDLAAPAGPRPSSITAGGTCLTRSSPPCSTSGSACKPRPTCPPRQPGSASPKRSGISTRSSARSAPPPTQLPGTPTATANRKVAPVLDCLVTSRE